MTSCQPHHNGVLLYCHFVNYCSTVYSNSSNTVFILNMSSEHDVNLILSKLENIAILFMLYCIRLILVDKQAELRDVVLLK